MLSILILSLFSQLSYSQFQVDGRVHVPTIINSETALIVAIHGCKQDAKLFSKITKLNELSDEENVIIYYP